jgi:ADP-ribosyl-[dinitrogen reductase] hydrolase
MTSSRADRVVATLLGTAVGDALGLPREGLSRAQAERILGAAPLSHRFLRGRGMISDDTEHAAMTAQALLVAGDDDRAFARSLAWRLRGWLVAMPPGIGWATLRAIVRLWIGVPPSRSGVRSAGNGPLMRAPILGAALADRPERLARFVRTSTRITHVDPRAEQAAVVVAFAAAHAVRADITQTRDELLANLRPFIADTAFGRQFDRMAASLRSNDTPLAFADAMRFENGVSGFAPDSACAALFCWLRYPASFREAVAAVIGLGGDADTTGAIVGGLAAATLGERAIPEEWLAGLAEWPRDRTWLKRLGIAVAAAIDDERPRASITLFWPVLPVRNVAFLVIAVAHIVRRWVVLLRGRR